MVTRFETTGCVVVEKDDGAHSRDVARDETQRSVRVEWSKTMPGPLARGRIDDQVWLFRVRGNDAEGRACAACPQRPRR